MSAPAGKRNVKTEPLPGALVTVTSPPIMRASLRERARPGAGVGGSARRSVTFRQARRLRLGHVGTGRRSRRFSMLISGNTPDELRLGPIVAMLHYN